ncbi:uncharacterized protein LOC128213575 [Mya arenaria]|uniref:uncharacterized protein LOC128213575 n=1 Tax=Mya arenaria TaxID=6604 RepID=UPI0022E8E7D3|nr:uncharacterized protein LOC128213575 [Mya arenaria]
MMTTKMASKIKRRNSYTNESKTINDLLREGQELPVIVTACSTDYEVPDQADLPDDTEILLDYVNHVQFAQIRVLPFQDENSVREEKGAEYVKIRRRLEALEFLIPVLYPGKLRYVNRPGHRTRFSSIQEVIESFPRHVNVASKMASCEPSGVHGTGPNVPALTILHPKRVYTASCTKLRYLQCNDGDQEFHFREDEIVNMTSLPDNNFYTLSDLKTDGALPACVQFTDVGPNEIVLDSDEDACRLLQILGWPIEVIGFRSKGLVCAYMPDENEICRSVALMPEHLLDTQPFQFHAAAKEMDDHVKKYFKMYKDNYWLRRSMYAFEATGLASERFTWLRRPSDYLHVTSDPNDKPPPLVPRRQPVKPEISKPQVAQVKPERSKPQVAQVKPERSKPQVAQVKPERSKPQVAKVKPERSKPQVAQVKPEISKPPTTRVKPVTNVRETRRQVSFSLEPDVSVYDIKLPIKKEEDRINIVRKSKLGFKKLHLELLEMFSTKDKKENPYGKRVKLKPSQRSKDKPHLETVIITNNSDKNTYGNAAAAPSSPVSPKSPGIHPMASRSLPPLPEQPKPPTEAKVNQSSVDLALRPPSQSNEGRIIYTQSDDGAEDVEEDTDRIYDEAEDEQHDYLEPLTLEDLKKISRPNQSSQDFYTYSVKEVIECFNLCFPDKPCLGTFCAEQRLDGSFFKRYEDPSMVFETLELSFIDKTKLKVIIHDGWRPKL